MFSGVVSQATNLQVVSSGLEGTYNEVVQVVQTNIYIYIQLNTWLNIHIKLCRILYMLKISAEFHVPSPVVPTRESYFVRQCRRHVDATWAVVDVSLDHLHSTPFNTCRRRPSGCLIQDMPNGYSKVIYCVNQYFYYTSSNTCCVYVWCHLL